MYVGSIHGRFVSLPAKMPCAVTITNAAKARTCRRFHAAFPRRARQLKLSRTM